jgi:hypothetical protein
MLTSPPCGLTTACTRSHWATSTRSTADASRSAAGHRHPLHEAARWARTSFKETAGGELLDWQKEFNTAVNKIRWKIEQVISHLKNWKILSIDHRRPLETFPETISAVIGLQLFRISE